MTGPQTPVGWVIREHALRAFARDLRVSEAYLRVVLTQWAAPIAERPRRKRRRPYQPPPDRAVILTAENQARAVAAARRTVTQARERLAESGGDLEVLRVRVEYPTASLAELGARLGMSKDAYAGRLRRALKAAS